jgi:hypothetical protein
VYSGLARLSSCQKAGVTPFCALPPLLLPIPLSFRLLTLEAVMSCIAARHCHVLDIIIIIYYIYNHHYVGTWHLRLASPLSLRTEAGHSALQIHSR